MAFEADTIKTHKISVDETGNSTKVLLAAGATFTGAWEEVLDYATVGVAVFGSMVTDGTLYIESSQDGGTTVNSVPFNIVDATFALPALWNIVESHIRIRYVNGTTAQTGSFQLQTKYSNAQELALLQSANDTLTDNTNVQVNRSIGVSIDPNGNYLNSKSTGIGFSTKANLASGAAFVSPIIDGRNYNQVQTHILSSHDGTMVFDFYSDSGGTDLVRSLSVPYVAANGFQLLSAPAFSDFIRYTFTNAVGATTTDFLYETKLLVGALSGQVLALNAFVAPSMVANLGRAIQVGKRPDGSFHNQGQDGNAIVTSALLGIGATFVSDWIDTQSYNAIEVHVSSDVVSAEGGILIEYTDDITGTPTVRDSSSFTFTEINATNGHLDLTAPPLLSGFRISYTNGAVAQASFFLSGDIRINGTTDSYNDGGALVVGNFGTEVALNNVPNFQLIDTYGIVNLLDAADGANTIWNYADDDLVGNANRKTFKTTAVQMWIASDNAADTAKDITITYNDSANIFQVVTVTLNGTTPVDCGVTAFDVGDAYLSSADSTLIGNVYIQQGNGFTGGSPDDVTNVLAYINPIYGKTQAAAGRVPANRQLIIDNVFISMQRASGSAGSARVFLRVKTPGSSWNIIRPFLVSNSLVVNKAENIVLPAGTLVEFYVDNISDSDTSINCIFSSTLVTL